MKKEKTSSGRINSGLIYKLLLDHSSELKPLKVTSKKEDEVTIQSLLLEEKVDLDQHTIAENLRAMQSIGLVDIAGDKTRGKWYAVREYLDEDSTNILLMSLYSNMNLGRTQIENLRDALTPLIGEESIKKLDGAFPKVKPYWNKNIASYIATIDIAIGNNKQVEYVRGVYDYKTRKMIPDPKKKDKTRKVNPMGVINSRGSLYMIYYDEEYGHESFIRLDSMYSLKETSVPRRVPQNFNIEEYLENRPYPSRGNIEKYEIIVDEGGDKGSSEANLSFVLQYFGENVDIFEKDGKLHVTLFTNRFSFKFWYLQYAEYFTIVSPLSVKEDIKKYIDEIDSKL